MARRVRTLVAVLGLLGTTVLGAPPAEAASAPLVGVDATTSGGFHTCARVDDQAVCWGANPEGQLGRDDRDEQTYAAPVLNTTGFGPLTGIKSITAGGTHTCARVTGNQVRCWGDNSAGQLGDGSFDDRLVPVTVLVDGTPLAGVSQLALGFTHTCALVTGGQVRCWGAGADGRLGNEETANSPEPLVVQNATGTGPLVGVVQISSQRFHTCARLSSGQVRCWGDGGLGKLGNGLSDDSARPVAVRGPAGTGVLTGVAQVATMANATCARLENGRVRCWGGNAEGQLGDGTTTSRLNPTLVKGPTGTPLSSVTAVAGGFNHACARTSDGRAMCWGRADEGQVGDGTSTDSRRAGPVQNDRGDADLRGVIALDLGDFHTCAVVPTGRSRCWGLGSSGQLAWGSHSSSPYPIPSSQPA